MVRKNIYYIEKYFFPEGWNGVEITHKIIDIFVKRGDRVNVLCGSIPYIKTDLSNYKCFTDFNSINIIRLIDFRVGKKLFLSLINSLLMSLHAFLILIFKRNIDMIVIQTNPPTIVLAGSLCAFLLKKPLLIIVMDIYPEVIINSGRFVKNKFLIKILKFPFNLSYRYATKVVSLGPVMTKRLLLKGVKKNRIVQISNWATSFNSANLYNHNYLNDKELTITYTGNLGTAHEIKTILNTAVRFKDSRYKIKFIFACQGSRYIELNKLVKKLEISSLIEIKDILPAKDFDSFINNSDISLVSINLGFEGLVVPSKAIGLMARGVPIIYIGPYSDISNLLINSNSGVCFNIGEDLKLYNYLKELVKNKSSLKILSNNAKLYYQENLAYEKARIKYLKLFQEMIPNFEKNKI